MEVLTTPEFYQRLVACAATILDGAAPLFSIEQSIDHLHVLAAIFKANQTSTWINPKV